jgi:hypothetical protein
MPQIPSFEEVEQFTEDASEIARLVDGLRSGSLPPEYVDKRIEERYLKKETEKKKQLQDLSAKQNGFNQEVRTWHSLAPRF